MKTEQANYTFSLKRARMFPKRKRLVKALGTLKDEVFKHSRQKNIILAPEVNEYIHMHSKNVPSYIDVVLKKESDTVRVFLQNGKQLEEFVKKAAEEKKKKIEKEKKEKEEKKTSDKKDETKETSEAKEDEKKKLEEKKQKEKAGFALEAKRKTGRK